MLPQSTIDAIMPLLMRHILFVLAAMGCFCLLLGVSYSPVHAAAPSREATASSTASNRPAASSRAVKPTPASARTATAPNPNVTISSRAAAGPDARYAVLKSDMEALKADARRSTWREPWQKLAANFTTLAARHPRWKNAAASAFRAAQCAEELSRRSCVKADSLRAAQSYAAVAESYPRSVLADDALLAAARLYAGPLRDAAAARALLDTLEKNYPRGDMRAAATALRSRCGSGDAEAASVAAGNAARAGAGAASGDAAKKPEQAQAPAGDAATAANRRGPRSTAEKPRPTRSVAARAGKPAEAQAPAGDTEKPRSARNSVAAGSTASRAFRPVSQKALAGMGAQLGLGVNTVFIDAGHGGSDPGAVHNGVREESITLDIARQLGAVLEGYGLRVLYSRTTDKGLSLKARTALANEKSADIFVSLHVNASSERGASGLECYFLDLARDQRAVQVAMRENNGSGRGLGEMNTLMARVLLHARILESRSLAADIQRQAAQHVRDGGYPLKDGGSRSAPFWVLMEATMPSVLVEVGYNSHAAEAARLKTPAYRRRIAEGVARGILRYKKRMENTTRAALNLTGGGAGAM